MTSVEQVCDIFKKRIAEYDARKETALANGDLIEANASLTASIAIRETYLEFLELA